MARSELLIVAVLLSGCAVHHRAPVQYIIPRACIVSIDMTDDTECRASEDGTKLICDHLKMERTAGCVYLRVQKKDKKQ